jgi:uncharacterized protein YndB with AHSA1/START domain
MAQPHHGEDLMIQNPMNDAMAKGLVARTGTKVDASVATVWDALVNPEVISQYMFGTSVVSDWKEGSPITWKGTWKGKAYEDRGAILELKPERIISYSHFSPLSGLPDIPENYHTVTIELKPIGTGTVVSLSQDNNLTEESREHSQKNWEAMLEGLKNLLESETHGRGAISPTRQ